MATSYTSLLGFALPVTGELQGTWGDTVNNSITQLCEDSIAGVATASVLSSDWTLTTTGAGAANQARMAILIPTGSPGVSRNIIAPSKSKTYTVINQSNAAVVVKGAATTGVSVASGDTVVVAWNGSDFVAVKNAAGTFTNLTYTGTLTGSTGVMNIGSGQIYKDASGNVGIGTISPSTKLDVAGVGRFVSQNSGATTSGAVTIRDYATNNSTGYVQWVDNSSTNQLGAIGGIAGGGLKLLSGVTERMRIDSSGNVGIGTISPSTKLDVAGDGRFISTNSGATTSGAVTIRDYATNNSTGYVQWVDNANTMQLGAIGGIAGGGLKLLSGVTERMRIDASGKLMLGTTVSGISRFNLISDINYGGVGYSQLITLTNGVAGAVNPNKFIRLSGTGDLEIVNSAYTGVLVGLDDTGVFTSYKTFSGNSTQSGNQFRSIYPGIRSYGFGTTSDYAFAIKDIDAGSERMRIDSSGNLLVGTTNQLPAINGVIGSSINVGFLNVCRAAPVIFASHLTTGILQEFRANGTTVVGSISVTGAATAYNTSSDYRLKTDLGVATSTEVVDNTIIHNFEWKADGSKSRGVFAQEAHVVKPEAVSVGTDELNEDGLPVHPWGVDYSKYVPDLIVYCKQLRKELDDLKSQLGK